MRVQDAKKERKKDRVMSKRKKSVLPTLARLLRFLRRIEKTDPDRETEARPAVQVVCATKGKRRVETNRKKKNQSPDSHLGMTEYKSEKAESWNLRFCPRFSFFPA